MAIFTDNGGSVYALELKWVITNQKKTATGIYGERNRLCLWHRL